VLSHLINAQGQLERGKNWPGKRIIGKELR